MSSSNEKITIINVMPQNLKCGTAAQFAEFTNSNLIALGVTSNGSIVLSPDWNLVIGLLLGMFGLVVVVIGSLYYFRKKAWATHYRDTVRRKKNVKDLEKIVDVGVNAKRGIKSNKVAVDDPDAPDNKNDLEAAAYQAAVEDQDIEFNDDLLLPEIAKSIQSYRDEIDRQLVNQNDLLKNLQDTLRKEVDELKGLLQMTSSDPNGEKKIHALLQLLKTSLLERAGFEGDSETSESKLLQELSHLTRLLNIGPDVMAQEIIEQVANRAKENYRKDIQPILSNAQSTTLHGLIEELEVLQANILSGYGQALQDEKRRSKNAQNIFDKFSSEHHINLPLRILDPLQKCKAQDIETDENVDQVYGTLKVFAERVPNFSNSMFHAESAFGTCLERDLIKGNNDALEHEERLSVEFMAAHLKDLLDAIKLLHEKVASKHDSTHESRVIGKIFRDELLAIIDDELSNITPSETNALLAQLLAILKEGGVSVPTDMRPGSSGSNIFVQESDTEEMEQDGSGVDVDETAAHPNISNLATIPENDSQLPAITTISTPSVLESALDNDNLTLLQKEEILESANSDIKMMDNMLELERRRQEEELKGVLSLSQFQNTVDDNQAATISKFAEEKSQLEQKLSEDHENKLKTMMRVGTLGLSDSDSPQDVKVATLASNRYTLLVKCNCMSSRLAYRQLQVQFISRRNKLIEEILISFNDNKLPLGEASGDVVTTNSKTILGYLDNHEKLIDLDNELEEQLKKLSIQLNRTLNEAIDKEDDIREKWLKNTAAVDVPGEVNKLKAECISAINSCRVLADNISQLTKQSSALEAANRSKIASSMVSHSFAVKENGLEILEALQGEAKASMLLQEMLVQEDARSIAHEESRILDILRLATSWGPKVDLRALQSHLNARKLAALKTMHSVDMDLNMIEHELRWEMKELRQISELNKRDASKEEIDQVFQNLNEAAEEAGKVARIQLNNKNSAIFNAEKERQELAEVDYERERFDALNQNSAANVAWFIKINKSRRKMLDEVHSALQFKLKCIQEHMQSRPLSEETRKLIAKQVEAETIREEYEMRAAYAAFESSCMVTIRYIGEVVEGLDASTSFGKEFCNYSHKSEENLSVIALNMDDAKRRLKKRVNTMIEKDLEAKRLMSLERPASELDAVYSTLEKKLQSDLNSVDEATINDRKQLGELLGHHLRDKLALQTEYIIKIELINQKYAKRIAEINIDATSPTTSFPNPTAEMEFLHQQQTMAALYAAVEVEYQDDLADAFKSFTAQFATCDKMQSDVRNLKQELQQQSEGEENFVLAEHTNRLIGLLDQQISRHNEAKALRDEYEMHTKGLEAQNRADKEKQSAFLKMKLEQKRKNRAKKLIADEGLTSADAEKIAGNEFTADLAAETKALNKAMEEKLRHQKALLDNNLDADVARIKNAYEKYSKVFEDGLEAVHEQELQDLRARLAKRRLEREKELKLQGSSPEDAANQAASESREEERAQLEQLSSGLGKIKSKLELEMQADIDRLQNAHMQSMNSIGEDIDRERRELEADLQERLRTEKEARINQLKKEGMQEKEAIAKANKELKAKEATEMQKILAAMTDKQHTIEQSAHEKLDRDLAETHSRYDQALNLLESGMANHQEQLHRRLEEKLSRMHAKRHGELMADGVGAAEASRQADAELASVKEQEMENINLAIKQSEDDIKECLQDSLQEKLLDLKLKQEMCSKGMEASLLYKKNAESNRIQERMARKHNNRKAFLLRNGETEASANSILDNEFSNVPKILEDAKQRIDSEASVKVNALKDALVRAEASLESRSQELQNTEDNELRQLRQELADKELAFLQRQKETVAETINAAIVASKAAALQSQLDLQKIRSQYDQELANLESSMRDKELKEHSLLKKRLAETKNARQDKLIAQGMAPAEAETMVSQEDQREEYALKNALQSEHERLIGEKLKEKSNAERQLFEKEHTMAEAQVHQAAASKDALQEKLEEVRRQCDASTSKLESDLAATRKVKENALKSRLADKKAHKMKELHDANVAEADRLAELEKIAQEEHQALMDLKAKEALEETQAREEQRRQQEEIIKQAEAEAKRAELEFAAIAAKEAALKAVKEANELATEETNNRELQRLRDAHAQQESLRLQEEENKKSKGKGRLDERLAAKRAKKEQELKEKEAKAVEDLKIKQAAELEEKERLREAKITWTERLREAQAKADEMGLSPAEREDFCLQETLGKKLLPDAQLAEAVEMIQHDRHAEEMRTLLTKNYQERVAALKAAVEKTFEEKSRQRVIVLERLGPDASEEEHKLALEELEAEFALNQRNAEEKATGALESVHMKQQMNLRQKQLEEVAKVVGMYTDPDSFAKLQQSQGKSYVEEMAEYRAKIEAEKLAREDAMRLEREKAEAKLRAEYEEEMNKMQAQLQADREKAHADLEKKRQDVIRQREDFEKKQRDDQSELETAEKARIMANFEKENAAAKEALEAEKRNQKAKLQDRLAKRKKTVVIDPKNLVAPSDKPPQAILDSVAEVVGSGDASSSSKAGLMLGEIKKTKSFKDAVANALKITKKTAKDAGAAAGAPKDTTTTPSAAMSPALSQSINLIESKLERIENIIMALQSQQPLGGGGSKASTANKKTTNSSSADDGYHDDNEPTPGDTCQEVAGEDIHIQERARLEFGLKLAALIGIKNLNIKIASSLPPSTASNNAFRNSYFYRGEDNTLLVHNSRVSSSGDFGLVVIHGLSHIKVNPNDMSDDADPLFLSEFYKNLKLLSQDLYKKSNTLSAMEVGTGSSGEKGSKPSQKNNLRNLMSLKTNTSDTGDINGTSAGGSNLMDANWASFQPSDDYFSEEKISERLKVYAKQGGIPQDYIERYAEYSKDKVKSFV